MSNISKAFQKAKQQGRTALIGYITAGDPNPEVTPKIAGALIKGGVDILELGLPFSDPIADGPTIQAASLRALKAGTTPMRVLQIVKEIKSQYELPIVVMSYYNPIFRIGLDSYLTQAKEYQVDGFIVPDLPVEEASDYKQIASKNGLDTIFLAAPSTSNKRLSQIVAASSGFLYLVSHFGVTGTQTEIGKSTIELIKRVKPFTTARIPLAVGFGISTPEHVQQVVAAGADATIVGSAFINIIQNSKGDLEAATKGLQTAASNLKKATKN
jgi:tryptophan synthase alpha chain